MLNLAIAAVVQASILTGGGDYSAAYKLAKQTQRPLLVLVGADWCPACQTMKNSVFPALQKAGGLEHVAFAVVNYDHQTTLARKLMRGSSIPQLIMYHQTEKGWQRSSLIGSQSVSTVQNLIDRGIKETAVAATTDEATRLAQEKQPAQGK
jgi:thioredoxin-like negative regulator of GroEL